VREQDLVEQRREAVEEADVDGEGEEEEVELDLARQVGGGLREGEFGGGAGGRAWRWGGGRDDEGGEGDYAGLGEKGGLLVSL
jgi:hypothetical protein